MFNVRSKLTRGKLLSRLGWVVLRNLCRRQKFVFKRSFILNWTDLEICKDLGALATTRASNKKYDDLMIQYQSEVDLREDRPQIGTRSSEHRRNVILTKI